MFSYRTYIHMYIFIHIYSNLLTYLRRWHGQYCDIDYDLRAHIYTFICILSYVPCPCLVFVHKCTQFYIYIYVHRYVLYVVFMIIIFSSVQRKCKKSAVSDIQVNTHIHRSVCTHTQAFYNFLPNWPNVNSFTNDNNEFVV